MINGLILAAWRHFGRDLGGVALRFEVLASDGRAHVACRAGIGIERVANFINGELVGSPTNGKWGVIFPKADALPRHPSQLYEAVSHFLLWAILLFLIKRHGDWARQKAGRLSLVFLSFHGFARYVIDFFRTDETYFGPLSSGQWTSLAVGLIGIGFLRFQVEQT